MCFGSSYNWRKISLLHIQMISFLCVIHVLFPEY